MVLKKELGENMTPLEIALDTLCLLTPGEADQFPPGSTGDREYGKGTPRIQVVRNDVLQATRNATLSNEGKVGVLNFASAKKPGGGFLRGAVAQEECLVRSSNLFLSIKNSPMYLAPKNGSLYTDYAQISMTTFFKDQAGNYVQPYQAEVVTCAAPNLSAVQDPDLELEEAYYKIYKARVRKVLSLFATYGCETLILGPWGCGVFGLCARKTAEVWKEALQDKDVSCIFACYVPPGTTGRDLRNYEIYSEVLEGK